MKVEGINRKIVMVLGSSESKKFSDIQKDFIENGVNPSIDDFDRALLELIKEDKLTIRSEEAANREFFRGYNDACALKSPKSFLELYYKGYGVGLSDTRLQYDLGLLSEEKKLKYEKMLCSE